MNRVEINDALCKGCLLCADACPKGIMESDTARVNARGYHPIRITDMAACTACAICGKICPDSVLTIIKEGGAA
jgi:2-oxoglutarate ferredoxin oxidoreductase subunit delta